MRTWRVACDFSHVYSFWISWWGVQSSHTLAFHMPKPEYSLWSCLLVRLCKRMIAPGVFWIFFDILNFFGLLGVGPRRGGLVKRQKIAQNKKEQLHLSRAISQEQCNLWSWFLVHLCKIKNDDITRCFFHFFGIWIFVGQKMAQDDKKICLLQNLGNHTYHVIFI